MYICFGVYIYIYIYVSGVCVYNYVSGAGIYIASRRDPSTRHLDGQNLKVAFLDGQLLSWTGPPDGPSMSDFLCELARPCHFTM